MKRFSLSILLALSLPISASAWQEKTTPEQPEQEQPSATGVVVLGFRWGTAGQVPVRETHTVGGAEVVSKYTITWKDDGEGEDLLVLRSPVEYESIGGKEVAADSPEVAPRRVQDLLTPGIKVSSKGVFRGFTSLKSVDMQLKKMEQAGEAAQAAAVRDAQKNQALMTTMRQRAREAWEIWQGAWIGTALAEGQTIEMEREAYPGIGMKRLSAKVKVECLEVLERNGARCMRVHLTVKHEGEEFAQAMESVLAELPGGQDLAKLGRLRSRTLDLEGLFEVSTGRPHEVVGTTTTILDSADSAKSEPVELVETRAFTFDWANAKLQKAAGKDGEAAPRGNSEGGDAAPKKKPGGGKKKE